MKIMLNASYSARADFSCIGYVGETNARTITFEGLVIEGADSYKMRFEYPDGTSYEVDITDGSYTVGGSLLRCACEVQCQIFACKAVGDKYELVKKSNIFCLLIKQSLDGEPAPVPSYEQTLELLEVLSNKLVVCDYADFPAVGIEGAIYAAQDKHTFYSWYPSEGRYIPYSTGGEGGTGNYEDLLNLPMFNGVRIIGDKSDEDYGIIGITNAELEKILK